MAGKRKNLLAKDIITASPDAFYYSNAETQKFKMQPKTLEN